MQIGIKAYDLFHFGLFYSKNNFWLIDSNSVEFILSYKDKYLSEKSITYMFT